MHKFPLQFKALIIAVTILAIWGLALMHSSGATTGVVQGAGNPVLAIGSAEVTVGDTVSVPLTLSEAPKGVAGFRIEITLDTPGFAEITDVSMPNYGLGFPELVSGSHVVIQAADFNRVIESGAANITLATLVIEGVNAGSSPVSLPAIKIDDDDGNPITADVQTGTFTVMPETPSMLSVGSAEVFTGNTASVQLILDDAPQGVSGFNIEVKLEDPAIASISQIHLPDYGLTFAELVDGGYAKIKVADIQHIVNPGDTDVTLATLDIVGGTAGSTAINAIIITFDDDNGSPINPDVLAGTIATVNVAPAVDAGPDAVIQEGQTFSRAGSFSDPGVDTWTATVNYGDGSGQQQLALNGMGFSLSRNYAKHGTYTVTVTVTDSHGASGTDSVQVTVNNVAPSVQLQNAVIENSMSYSGAGSFSDPGADTWTATVNYGDGSGVKPLPLNSKSFQLDHQYPAYGTYTVTVTVTDGGGASGTGQFKVEVRHVCPLLPGLTERSRDIDGDFKCEDVNGNGRLDFADIVYLFQNLLDPEVQSHAEHFDFNDNNRLDMDDLVRMFQMIVEQQSG